MLTLDIGTSTASTITVSPGLPTVIVGGSSAERNNVAIASNVSITNGLATVTLANQPLTHTGALVSIGYSNPTNAFQRFRYTGPLTRTGSQTITVPALNADGSNFIDGSATGFSVRLLQHFAPPSLIRRSRDALNGAISLVASYGQSGERTLDKLQVYTEWDKFNPRMLYGSWGLGNDIAYGNVFPSETISNMSTMLSYHTAKGRLCVVELPPCPPAITATQTSIGLAVIKGLVELAKDNPLIVLVDAYRATCIPNTGQGDASLFVDSTNIHYSNDGANLIGALTAMEIVGHVGTIPNPLCRGSYDRVSADPANSTQIAEGLWSNASPRNAATLDARASGAIDTGFNGVAITGTTAAAVFSQPLAADGLGYAMKCVFTATAGSTITISYDGPAGSTMASRLIPGATYDSCCNMTIEQSSPGVLAQYEHYLLANLTYGSAVNARLCSHMRRDDDIPDPPPLENINDVPAIFPDFTIPAATTVASTCRWTINATMQTDGAITITWWNPTMRQRV